MPHLVKVQEKYADKGMILLGFHRQSSDLKTKVLALCAQKDVNFMVSQQGSLANDNSRGIPRSWVFDWTGKKVWEGHPSQVDGVLEDLMKKAPHFLTKGKELTDSKVLGYSRKLFANRSFDKIIDGLAKTAEGAEDGSATKTEAEFLKANVVAYGESRLAKAKSLEKTDPIEGYKLYYDTYKLFKGHDIGAQAKTRYDELKKDKDFKDEMAAGKYYALIKKVQGQLKPGGSSQKANIAGINQIATYAKMMNKKYPTSVYTGKARQIARSPGVTID